MTPSPGWLMSGHWHRWCWHARWPYDFAQVSAFLPVHVAAPVWLPMNDDIPF